MLVTFFPFALLCMASPNQIGDNTHSVKVTVPSESITLPESFYDLSESLERYSQSPDINLQDPRYQLVMLDSHSESDHGEATSACTPERIQQLIQAHATQSSMASGPSLPTSTTTTSASPASPGNLGKSIKHPSRPSSTHTKHRVYFHIHLCMG